LVPNVGAGLAPDTSGQAPALFRAGSAKGNRGLWETRAGASPAPTDGRFGHFLPKTENLKQSQYNMLDFNNLQGVSSKKQVKLFVTRHLKFIS
jgi:hypothetical protein